MVYRRLCGQAAAVLATGQSVIADGVFAGAADRAAIEAVAAASGVPFAGVWLSAPPDVLSTRVAHRPPDASDADARVVALQVGLGAGPLDWCSVDAAPPLEVVLGEVRAHAGGVEVPVAGARGRTGT
jgi:predicted kinase